MPPRYRHPTDGTEESFIGVRRKCARIVVASHWDRMPFVETLLLLEFVTRPNDEILVAVEQMELAIRRADFVLTAKYQTPDSISA